MIVLVTVVVVVAVVVTGCGCGVVCVELLVELLIAICLPAGQHQGECILCHVYPLAAPCHWLAKQNHKFSCNSLFSLFILNHPLLAASC